MRNRVLIACLFMLGCSPSAPDPVASPGNNNSCVITGGGTCVIGDGSGNVTNPTPNPSGSPGGDNTVTSFAIFCYGFGAQPGQPEPNHNACILPVGYPNIAVTSSPKNKAGVDVPNPGDKTDPTVVDWTFVVSPSNAATLVIQGDNRFNARVEPANPRISATFTLVSTYKDPQGNVWQATKSGGIQ
jgi:hypothetical protein